MRSSLRFLSSLVADFRYWLLAVLFFSFCVLLVESAFALYLGKYIKTFIDDDPELLIYGFEVSSESARYVFALMLSLKVAVSLCFYKFLFNHVYQVKSHIQNHTINKLLQSCDFENVTEKTLVTSQHLVGYFYAPLLTLITESIVVLGLLAVLVFVSGYEILSAFLFFAFLIYVLQRNLNKKTRELSLKRKSIEEELSKELEFSVGGVYDIRYSNFLTNIFTSNIRGLIEQSSLVYGRNSFLNALPRISIEILVYSSLLVFSLPFFKSFEEGDVGLLLAIAVRLASSGGKILGSAQNISFSAAPLDSYLELYDDNGVNDAHPNNLNDGLLSEITDNSAGLFVVCGLSGAGKSTLLLEVAEELDKRDFVFNYVGQLPYIVKGCFMGNMTTTQHNLILARSVDLGLGRLLNRDYISIDAVSGGERSRVGLLRGISQPGILLIDEPTSALDSKSAIAVRDLIRQESTRRVVVCVSHDELLIDLADRRVEFIDVGKYVFQ